MKTTNYYDTFIEVAEDCPVQSAEIPPQKGEKKTAVRVQYEMISDHPYEYTSDDVIFSVVAAKNDIPLNRQAAEREQYFSKGRACLRSSALGKRYGWGIHSNGEGKIAMYPVESDEYEKLADDKKLNHLKAMRSKRA